MNTMSSRGTSQGLSIEEEAELTKSNEKVKDFHHANFMEDNANDGKELSWGKGHATHHISFKDKLVGEILGHIDKHLILWIRWMHPLRLNVILPP